MKATVNASVLEKELKLLSTIVKKNTVMPVLSCCKLEFSKDKLKISATDLETTGIVYVDCKCSKPFGFIIEFTDIMGVCSKVSEPIILEEKDNSIFINAGNSKFKFTKFANENDFPKVPEEDYLFSTEVTGDFFFALTNANSCKSKESTFVHTNLVCADFKNGSVVLVGVDNVIAYKNELKIECNKELRVMLPETFVNLTKSFQETKLSVGENFIMAKYKHITIVSRLSEQKFAPYQHIMPKSDVVYNFKVNREEFKKSLQLVSLTANSISYLCRLDFKDGEVKVSSQNIDLGNESDTTIDAEHEVNFEAICINGSKMIHLLNLLTSEEVQMAFLNHDKTIYIKPEDDSLIDCLIQPLLITTQN
jgi:DNA polymerase-3 subunit beta